MNEEQFSRTQLLIGAEALQRLHRSKVAVFGVGGVGGYVVEALVRSGVGSLELIDNDTVSVSNLNRQIIATYDTIGRYKTEAASERARSINPAAAVICRNCFYLPENAAEFDFASYDYVVDAVDTVTAKLDIIERCVKAGVPVISSMGAGNKLDPSGFHVMDLSKTKNDPLAKVMRRELRKRGIEHLKVVCSEEQPLMPTAHMNEESAQSGENSKAIAAENSGMIEETAMKTPKNAGIDVKPARRRAVPGSMAFVPAAAGLVIAGEIVRDLAGL